MNALEQRYYDCPTSAAISDSEVKPAKILHLPISVLSIRKPTWEISVEQQLKDIMSLNIGWDGYFAGPIRRDVIKFAVKVLGEIMQNKTPPPHIAPMSHEGIMLEWHECSIDLEIEIERPGYLWVAFYDAHEGVEKEDLFSTQLGNIADMLCEITNRSIQ